MSLNVHGESTVEGKGTSVFNAYNGAATLDEVFKLIRNHQHADSSNVGIATPYPAQIRKYKRALKRASKDYPDLDLHHIRVGTAEFWQGSELAHMFVDFVRASNDAGALGFVSDARRLNVLITRQTVGLWIICDERCVLTLDAQRQLDNPIIGLGETNANPTQTGETKAKVKKTQEDQRNTTVIAMFAWMREKLWVICDERCVLTLEKQAAIDNPIETQVKDPNAAKPSREDKKNKTVIAVLDWRVISDYWKFSMRKNGRVVNIAKESLTEKYVAFPTAEDKKDESEIGWGSVPVPAAEEEKDEGQAERVADASDAKK